MYKFDGIYRYSPKFATNWRSVVALIVGVAPPLPGFINSIDRVVSVWRLQASICKIYLATRSTSTDTSAALQSVMDIHLSLLGFVTGL
jgi:cytosine/uracil/thiamine/allantoin permease